MWRRAESVLFNSTRCRVVVSGLVFVSSPAICSSRREHKAGGGRVAVYFRVGPRVQSWFCGLPLSSMA